MCPKLSSYTIINKTNKGSGRNKDPTARRDLCRRKSQFKQFSVDVHCLRNLVLWNDVLDAWFDAVSLVVWIVHILITETVRMTFSLRSFERKKSKTEY